MIVILIIVMVLGMWALQLMEQAYERKEFSRMVAGMLVIFAAAGVMTVYFFLHHYMTFMVQQQELHRAMEVWQRSVLVDP